MNGIVRYVGPWINVPRSSRDPDCVVVLNFRHANLGRFSLRPTTRRAPDRLSPAPHELEGHRWVPIPDWSDAHDRRTALTFQLRGHSPF